MVRVLLARRMERTALYSTSCWTTFAHPLPNVFTNHALAQAFHHQSGAHEQQTLFRLGNEDAKGCGENRLGVKRASTGVESLVPVEGQAICTDMNALAPHTFPAVHLHHAHHHAPATLSHYL